MKDPTEQLASIRDMAGDIRGQGQNTWTTSDNYGAAFDLAEAIGHLDRSIAGGGVLPQQWRSPTVLGHPRCTEDGVVLDDVEHGKRGSYNKGCRCLACRRANADWQTERRARAKGETDANQ